MSPSNARVVRFSLLIYISSRKRGMSCHAVSGSVKTMEVVMEEISERLREFRERKSMSQSELSRALNISRGGVNRWEKGDAHKMSLDIAIRACEVLGVTLEELGHGTEAVGALDVEALAKAMSLVSAVFKRMDDSDRANLVSMVYQLVAQGNEVPPSLVTQMAALIR